MSGIFAANAAYCTFKNLQFVWYSITMSIIRELSFLLKAKELISVRSDQNVCMGEYEHILVMPASFSHEITQ